MPKINGAHQRGAPDWGADFRDKCVGDAERHCQQRGRDVAQAQAAQRPENYERQDGDVHAGDDQDVVGAGALEIGAGVAIEEGVFADDHGVNQGSLARGPEFVNLGDYSSVQAAAPGGDPAAGEAGEALDILDFG